MNICLGVVLALAIVALVFLVADKSPVESGCGCAGALLHMGSTDLGDHYAIQMNIVEFDRSWNEMDVVVKDSAGRLVFASGIDIADAGPMMGESAAPGNITTGISWKGHASPGLAVFICSTSTTGASIDGVAVGTWTSAGDVVAGVEGMDGAWFALLDGEQNGKVTVGDRIIVFADPDSDGVEDVPSGSSIEFKNGDMIMGSGTLQ